jgi:putative transposase
MNFSIRLSQEERNSLLDYYRGHDDPAIRLRAHIILLLAEGHSWGLISAVLFCSSRTIARWKARFEAGRLPGLIGRTPGAPPRYGHYWVTLVVHWFTACLPRDFGFVRSRWTCALAVLLLWQDHRLHISQETIRRWLHRAALVWRRPRPVLRRRDPQRDRILAGLRTLLRDLPADETAVFTDEVDINLNPDIGFMWMRRGQQAQVVTPGVNAKNYLAGSLNWRTGTLLGPVTGPNRNGALVAAHLEKLCHRLRCYKVIHLIWDHAKIHDCGVVNMVLAKHADRLRVHWLPKYAPECNPAERVWWHLREEITRNHRCQTLEELIDLVFAWLDGSHFIVEDSVYKQNPTKKPKTRAA